MKENTDVKITVRFVYTSIIPRLKFTELWVIHLSAGNLLSFWHLLLIVSNVPPHSEVQKCPGLERNYLTCQLKDAVNTRTTREKTLFLSFTLTKLLIVFVLIQL